MSDSHTGADDSNANGDGSVVSRRTALALLASAGTIGGGAIALRHFEAGPGTTARRTTQETTGDATTTTERRSLLDDPGLASQHPLGPYLDTLAVAAENAMSALTEQLRQIEQSV
jgi:hypothetical protein